MAEYKIHKKEWTWQDQPLSKEDSTRCDVALHLWATLCKDVLPDAANKLFACLGRYKSLDIYRLIDELNSARSALLIAERGGLPSEWDATVKGCVTRSSYPFAKVIWTSCGGPAVWEDPDLFRRFLTMFSFLSRLNLHELPVLEKLRVDYDSFESQHEFPLPGSRCKLRDIWTEWLQAWDVDLHTLRCNHGPGAVAGHRRCSTATKFGMMSCFESSPITRYDKYPWLPEYASLVRSDIPDYCEVVFVPKSYKTYRTISKEPCINMWMQQGIRHSLYDYIERNSQIPISFRHTERSQQLCVEGSNFGDYSTIDCSAASDSVGAEQIGYLLSQLPAIQELVFACRTRYYWNDGKRTKLRKFAPMGSALCFPIESLFFASICELTRREADPNRPWRFKYLVYGDDIVVDSRIARRVIQNLQAYGVRVNEEKTFTTRSVTSAYREACGVEAYAGVDVTPLRIPRFWDGWLYASRHCQLNEMWTAIQSNIDFINNAFDFGAKHLRRELLCLMEAIVPLSRLPFRSTDVDGGSGIKTTAPTHWRNEVIWDDDTQQYMQRVVVPRYEDTPYDASLTTMSEQDALYWEWCYRPSRRLHELVDERAREVGSRHRQLVGVKIAEIPLD